MRSLLATSTILLASFGLGGAEPTDSGLPNGRKPRASVRSGGRESPGLEQAAINYEHAKILVAQAQLLVRDAEKAVEIEQAKMERYHHAQENRSKTQEEVSDNDNDKPARDGVADKPGLDEPREDKPHVMDAPPDESASYGTDEYVQDGDEIMENEDPEEKPSICGTSIEEVEEVCREKRPICKYKKIKNPNDPRGYIISEELADGEDEGNCLRRCDNKYGLSPEHCGEGQDCITEVLTCGDCDILTEKGACQYFI